MARLYYPLFFIIFFGLRSISISAQVKAQIVQIDKNVYQFTFVKDKSEFSCNITVFIDGKTAIIIDVAYKKYADYVKRYLSEKGIRESVTFISHHHEDHFDGCKSFKESKTFASKMFSDDYQEHLQNDDYLRTFEPDEFLIDGDYFITKNFKIKYIYTPGHNKCEFSFLINDKYLYAGDLIFYNKDGLPSIPYIDENSTVDEYIESLGKIKKIDSQYLLLGHGAYIDNKEKINRQIDDKLYYLQKIKSSNGSIDINECLVQDSTKYSGLNFHLMNLDHIKNYR